MAWSALFCKISKVVPVSGKSAIPIEAVTGRARSGSRAFRNRVFWNVAQSSEILSREVMSFKKTQNSSPEIWATKASSGIQA